MSVMLKLRKPPKPKGTPGRRYLYGPLVERDPDNLSGGRRLAGAEFARRQAELEAREAEERLRRRA